MTRTLWIRRNDAARPRTWLDDVQEATGAAMIQSGFGVLALFSLLSLLFGGDRRETAAPNDSPTSWFDPLR
jgi:hypothetical protein